VLLDVVYSYYNNEGSTNLSLLKVGGVAFDERYLRKCSPSTMIRIISLTPGSFVGDKNWTNLNEVFNLVVNRYSLYNRLSVAIDVMS
jgi:hypothetical protein